MNMFYVHGIIKAGCGIASLLADTDKSNKNERTLSS